MGKRISKEERRKALQERTNKNVQNSGKSEFGARYLSTTGYDEVKWFKPQSKVKNCIDILPYVITTKNHPQGMKIGYEDYLLDLFVHKNVGPRDDSFICLSKNFGKPCPICEEMARLSKEGKDDEAKAIKPSRRAVYNVIDLNNPDEGIQLFDVSHWLFEKELTEELKGCYTDGEIPIFSDLEEGMSIKFRGSDKVFKGNKYLEYKTFSFEDRDEDYDDKILDEVYPLDAMLVIPTYEEVYASFYGEDADEEEEEVEEKPARRSKAKKEVEVEEEIEDEEVEEESAPKKRRERKSKVADTPKIFDACEEEYEKIQANEDDIPY